MEGVGDAPPRPLLGFMHSVHLYNSYIQKYTAATAATALSTVNGVKDRVPVLLTAYASIINRACCTYTRR